MGFDAGASVAPLDWDFTRFGGGSGVTPEPTTQQIEKFLRSHGALQQSVVKAKSALAMRLDELSPEEAKQRLLEWAELDRDQAFERAYRELDELGDSDEMEQYALRMATMVAEVCSDCPSVEQILKIPHRVRIVFYRWIIKELNDPELFAVATKPSLSVVSGG